MKCIIPEISWHNRDPVLSVDIQPRHGNSDDYWRLASGGTDSHVLIWYITIQDSGVANLEFAADLVRHQRAVNVVRFSPSGEFLASGDDESVILIWKQKTDQDLPEFPMNDEEGNAKEQWISLKVLRGHVEDVYDLCWSPDSNSLISGSVDNSAIFWDVQKGRNTGILNDHKGFVQGVAWDPQNQFVATMSSDRLCRIFNVNTKRVVNRIYKSWLPGIGNAENPEEKLYKLYHDDTLKSFFRRLTFTPDGELLITPAGIIEQDGDLKNINVTYIYSRHLLNRPVVYLPTGDKYTIAVRCCPLLYELRGRKTKTETLESQTNEEKNVPTNEEKEIPMEEECTEKMSDGFKTPNQGVKNEKPWEKHSSLFALPYRVVFAVATQNSVFLYDTQQPVPFAKISNIHYTRLTDLTWSSDGRVLVVSSTDGYCSVITFSEGELGVVYNDKNEDKISSESPSNEKSKKGENKTSFDDEHVIKGTEKLTSPLVENPGNAHLENGEVKRETEILSSEAVVEGKKINDSQKEIDSEPVVGKATGCLQRSVVLKCKQDCGIDSCLPSAATSNNSLNNSSCNKNIEKLNNTSPSKNSNVTDHLHMSSPKVKGNVTPVQEQKKTPRRVQLITLSSPKSKKRLL